MEWEHRWFCCRSCGNFIRSPKAYLKHKRECFVRNRCGNPAENRVTKSPEDSGSRVHHSKRDSKEVAETLKHSTRKNLGNRSRDNATKQLYSSKQQLRSNKCGRRFKLGHTNSDTTVSGHVVSTNQSRNIKKRHGIGKEEKRFKCVDCNYRTANRGHLKNHSRTHTGEKPYKCHHCSYSCSRTHHLKQHIQTHTGEKPYKCELCNYAASQHSHLVRHRFIHTGEKRYKCQECEYATTFGSALKEHIRRLHRREKTFKCEYCGHSCTTSGEMKIHIRTHTGEKPFKCQQCDHRCTTSGSLK